MWHWLCHGSRVGEAVKSGLKVLIDGCDISHDTLPVWPFCVHHLIYVLEWGKKQYSYEGTILLS